MQRRLLLILFFWCSMNTFATTPRICHETKASVPEIIAKIKTLRKINDNYHLALDLAIAYMVGSVHDDFMVCSPAYILRDKDWGSFRPHKRGEPWEYITWDGNVKRKQYLQKAEVILNELGFEEGSWHLYLKLYLGWIYEKQGKLKEAIAVHQFVIEKGIELVEKNFTCKLEPCGQLMATLESLKFLKRIYKAQGKKEKIKEIDSLLQVNIKKVVGPNDFKGDFFRHMHKDDPEKLEQLDEFMKKHEVTK